MDVQKSCAIVEDSSEGGKTILLIISTPSSGLLSKWGTT